MHHSIILKNKEQIEKMRLSGYLSAQVLEEVNHIIKPGITTQVINDFCHNYIVNKQNAIPACLNYRGFPKSICTSINHVVCHGIPSSRKLKKGDIINIDVTVIKNGFHGDSSKMFFVGGRKNTSIIAQRLVDASYECLIKGIKQAKPGNRLYDIASAIEIHAKSYNFSVVESFCGHGIGKFFHEDPQILHYTSRKKHEIDLLNTIIEPGMTFTIEPMINIGKKDVTILSDGWTVVTKDKSLSSQWEHTLAITQTGADVLTKRKNEDL